MDVTRRVDGLLQQRPRSIPPTSRHTCLVELQHQTHKLLIRLVDEWPPSKMTHVEWALLVQEDFTEKEIAQFTPAAQQMIRSLKQARSGQAATTS